MANITAIVRGYGWNPTRATRELKTRADMTKAIDALLPLVQEQATETMRHAPVTRVSINKALLHIKHERRNGHAKRGAALPLLDHIDTRLGRFTRRTPAEGDSIDKAIGDLIDVVARIEGFVKQAKLAQQWLVKMRRELPEVQA